jgi:hypothetical protein
LVNSFPVSRPIPWKYATDERTHESSIQVLAAEHIISARYQNTHIPERREAITRIS